MPDFHPLTQALLTWFETHQRPLPWRSTYDPYQVWISEIMLQQTQMQRATAYFKRWISQFPDIKTLAKASTEQVLKNWEGLGYYARAHKLHHCAHQLLVNHDGRVPDQMHILQSLPGIGPYTAAAIASIAYGLDVCAIDANVERVMSRLFDISVPVKSVAGKTKVHDHCEQLLPQGLARQFNQALMDLGSLVCTRRQPACTRCPLRTWCQTLSLGVQHQRPVTPKPQKPIHISMATGVLIHAGYLFVQQRKLNDIWGGLWEFPGGVVEEFETPSLAVLREYLEETRLKVHHPASIGDFKHSYTRYRVTMHAFFVELEPGPHPVFLHEVQQYRWVRWPELKKLAFPAGHAKLIQALETDPHFIRQVQA